MNRVPTSIRRASRWRRLAAASAWTLGATLRAAELPVDFSARSLEQLAQIKVTTATKRAQPLWTTPAALSVITDEELRLSGANSLPQALRLAPGVDVAQINAERNDFTGWEYLPSARLTWTPSARRTGWLAVSRGLQTPDLSSYDLTIDIPGAVRVRSLPSRNRPAGEIMATEAGWRVTPSPTLSIDTAVFLNRYDALSSSSSTFDARTSTLTVMPMNDQFGETHGGELAALWEPTRRWRLRASYSLLRMHLHVRAGSTDGLSALREEQRNPREQWQLMSTAHLGQEWDLTGWVRYVAPRTTVPAPAYVGCDVRLARRLTPSAEIALIGKNLLDARHPEFSRSPGVPANSEIPRSVQLEFSWAR